MSAAPQHLRAVPVPGGGAPVDWWIAADGRLSARPVAGAAELPGGWVAPGMVDAHAHLTFEAHERIGLPRGSGELVAAHLDAHRRAGVLAVRDAGALPGVRLPSEGGRVIGCGPFLAPPGLYLAHLYDGVPEDAAVAVGRSLVRDGGLRWVKIVADFPAGGGSPLEPRVGYPLALVRAICDAVHEEGGRVAAHAMGPVVREIVTCGIDSVEHGTHADAATLEAMAARGVAWTPTVTTVAGHLEPIAARVPAAAALLDLHRRMLPFAAALGVTVLCGTDEEPHGTVAAEAAALCRYGLPAAAAVAGATTAARAFLGLPGLADGAPADLVLFDRDPVADVSALAAPAAVLLGGVRVA